MHLWVFSTQWIKIILLQTETINLFQNPAPICYWAQSPGFPASKPQSYLWFLPSICIYLNMKPSGSAYWKQWSGCSHVSIFHLQGPLSWLLPHTPKLVSEVTNGLLIVTSQILSHLDIFSYQNFLGFHHTALCFMIHITFSLLPCLLHGFFFLCPPFFLGRPLHFLL